MSFGFSLFLHVFYFFMNMYTTISNWCFNLFHDPDWWQWRWLFIYRWNAESWIYILWDIFPRRWRLWRWVPWRTVNVLSSIRCYVAARSPWKVLSSFVTRYHHVKFYALEEQLKSDMWWFFHSSHKLAWLPSSISSSMLSSKSIYKAWCNIDLDAKKNNFPTRRFIHSFPRTKLVHKAREFLCFHFAVAVNIHVHIDTTFCPTKRLYLHIKLKCITWLDFKFVF